MSGRDGLSVVINCDGASRGNPGPAGLGAVVATRDGQILATVAEGLGETTNNVAEYRAAIAGLTAAAGLGATDVLLRSDSKLLVEQLAGRYRVKNARLKGLHAEALKLARGFGSIEFEHVRREFNVEADRLANEGVDRWLATGTIP